MLFRSISDFVPLYSLAKRFGPIPMANSSTSIPFFFAKEYKGTKYCIKLLPIGGLCMMGEDEEATDAPGNFKINRCGQGSV